MDIIFKGESLTLKATERMWIIYENMVNDPDSDIEKTSHTSTTMLIYAAIKAAIKRKNMREKTNIDDNITLDDVIEFIDDNDSLLFVAKFNKWLQEDTERQSKLIAKLDKEENEEEPKSTKKKSNE